MIVINADSLRHAVETARKKGIEAKTKSRDEYRSHILAMYRELLKITPQYSSDMVSNWDLVVGDASARGYVESHEKIHYDHDQGIIAARHNAGDEDAGFASAYMRGVNRVGKITHYGQPVYFVNSSPLEIDTPLIAGPDGVQELRDSGVTMAWLSITSYLQERYGAPRT